MFESDFIFFAPAFSTTVYVKLKIVIQGDIDPDRTIIFKKLTWSRSKTKEKLNVEA